MTYTQKLRDPRWQKKRLQILERDQWTCQSCRSTEKNLQVHHLVYAKRDPWDYADDCYQTLCEDCHEVRQELSDKAANALKLALKNTPTEAMPYVADLVIDLASADGFRQHVVMTLHECFNASEKGEGVLDHGLFSDALMDFMSCQFLGSDEISKRAVGLLRKSIEKLEAQK